MLHSTKNSVYRLSHIPPEHLPLTVRSAGTYRLLKGSLVEPPFEKWFAEIFWCESGAGEFRLSGQSFSLKAGEVCYLLPGELHDLRPTHEPWKYHWLTLDHRNSPTFLESFGFVERPFRAGDFPTKLFQSILDSIGQGTASGDRQAAHLTHELLLAATELRDGTHLPKASNWVVKCRDMIDRHYTEPTLNVNELADQLQVHRATLFRVFKQTYKMTPSQYLQSRRLHYAMELLKAGRHSIKEVAQLSGITDQNYLTKLIRRKSGFSPRDFRASYNKGRLTLS
ncbi:MAG: AraC family transcriptional regulator [Verrucomicrobiota bacterium JB024]|nr:AraC family transcriptional regulator [Verrucomicrobiota bacterium JB024]